jgi:hypothetical protein
VVQVNNKPQYLVFCSRSGHLVSKCLYLSVESVNGLARCGFPSPALPQTLCKLGLAVPLSPSLKGSSHGGSVQGAETVQLGGGTVGVVEKGPGNVGRKNRGRSYCSNCDLLVQYAHDADSARPQPVKHHMLPLFVTVKSRTHSVTRSAHLRALRKDLEARLKALCIPDRLVHTPSFKVVSGDGSHVRLRWLRDTVLWQCPRPFLRSVR